MAKADWKRKLARVAQRCAGAEAGIACAGTKLEATTFGVGNKVFVFLGANELRLKLGASRNEAKALGCDVGKTGWVKVAMDDPPSADVLERWIAESHALVAGPRAAR